MTSENQPSETEIIGEVDASRSSSPPESASEHPARNPTVFLQNPTIIAEEPQSFVRLLQIVASLEAAQNDIATILQEIRHSGIQIDALTRQFTDPAESGMLEEQLAELITRQETNEEQLRELSQAINKLNRTQFKANALTESKVQQTATAIGTLQEIVTRREEVRGEQAWQNQRYLAAVGTKARGELAVELLPALDGLESVLQNGSMLLERQQEQEKRRAATLTPEPASPTLSTRLRNLFAAEPPPANATVADVSLSQMTEALAAWLEGLHLVHERFLRLLADENIQAIAAQDQAFDPHLHVAVAAITRDDIPAGTIVAEERKGYRQNDRVLRFAEVVVAKASDNS